MNSAAAAFREPGLWSSVWKLMRMRLVIQISGFRRAKPSDKIYMTLKREGAMVAALKWVLNDTNVHTTIPSMTDMDQLDINFRAMGEKFGAPDEKVLPDR